MAFDCIVIGGGPAGMIAAITAARAGKNVVLLENHGALSVGATVIDAMNMLEAAEATARNLTLAKQIGTPKDLPTEECRILWQLHEQRMNK